MPDTGRHTYTHVHAHTDAYTITHANAHADCNTAAAAGALLCWLVKLPRSTIDRRKKHGGYGKCGLAGRHRRREA